MKSYICDVKISFAPVAQLDRASNYGLHCFLSIHFKNKSFFKIKTLLRHFLYNFVMNANFYGGVFARIKNYDNLFWRNFYQDGLQKL